MLLEGSVSLTVSPLLVATEKAADAYFDPLASIVKSEYSGAGALALVLALALAFAFTLAS